MDRFDPKWGDRWGNLWFSVQVVSMMGGVQASVTLLGSMIYALIRKTIPLCWAAVSILPLCGINHFAPTLINAGGASAAAALFLFPTIALLPLLIPVFQRKRRDGPKGGGANSAPPGSFE